jgi:hypothetical protein
VTDEDPIEGKAAEPLAQASRVCLTAPGEMEVRPSGMLASDRPLRLALPSQVNCWE